VTASARGKPIEWLKRGTEWRSRSRPRSRDVLLIDLASPQLDAVNAIREIKSGDNKSVTVIGYVDHTRADVNRGRRAAGCG